MTELKLREWISLEDAVAALAERTMKVDPEFVLANWSCKYIDARIDMRTGAVYLSPGNTRILTVFERDEVQKERSLGAE